MRNLNYPLLVIIYNHHYLSNIDRIHEYYSKNFNNIVHLVPFYEGYNNNVMTVYYSSHNFSGYVSTLSRNINEDYSHFIFVADDLILSPHINQFNYQTTFNLNLEKSYFPHFINYNTREYLWPRITEAYQFDVNQNGAELGSILPDRKTAENLMAELGIYCNELKWSQIWNIKTYIAYLLKSITTKFTLNDVKSHIVSLAKNRFSFKYPLAGGYSDFFIVDSYRFHKFAHYCGVFAASGLFVEFAIPTSLIISNHKNIITEVDGGPKGLVIWPDGWTSLNTPDGRRCKGLKDTLIRYKYSFSDLIDNFPNNTSFVHPIKLSIWR